MLARFRSKKQNILDSLRKSPDDYKDLSPKGNLDDEIHELIKEINSLPDYVTTSSCAGRVAVYLEGEAKSQAGIAAAGKQDEQLQTESSVAASKSGKGGGKWLFISHQALDLEPLSAPGALLAKLGFYKGGEISFPPVDSAVRLVHLKFEPMILHVLAGSAESAQTMLGAGMTAGFRESGISGIVDGKGRASIPMVAVRSTGLAMDCIIGFRSPNTQQILPMVSEEYLRTIIRVTNDRFRQNVERKERFRQRLLMQFAGSMPLPDDRLHDYRRKGGYQSSSERKAEKRAEDMRKREEALERRAHALHRGGALDGAAEGGSTEADGDDLALNVLQINGTGDSQ